MTQINHNADVFFQQSQYETRQLLSQLGLYNSVTTAIRKIDGKIVVEQSKGMLADQAKLSSLINNRTQLRRQLQSTGDAMIYLNPLVWILYEQTKNQKLTTIHDFIADQVNHVICGKRLLFLNNQIHYYTGYDLSHFNNFSFPDLYANKVFLGVIQQPQFTYEWLTQETAQTKTGETAKWGILYYYDVPHSSFQEIPANQLILGK